jgi:anti-sigma B factor antagonist
LLAGKLALPDTFFRLSPGNLRSNLNDDIGKLAMRVSHNLDSTLESVNQAEEMATQVAMQAGFESEAAAQIAMAVREAAVNAVLHGNAYDSRKKIGLRFEQDGERLVIIVRDQGKGMDPHTVPDPLAPENLLKQSGRGIFLMRAFMDEVHIRNLDPGTEVTMVKHLQGHMAPGKKEETVVTTMKSSTRQVDGITIVDLSGRITLGEGSVVLRDKVRELLGKGQTKILLNMDEVTYIDSSGIGELVSAFTTVRNQGGDLKLLNLTKKVHDLLQITKLYTVFDIKDDEAAAVASFSR